ncbi:MAG: radical SAM protein [Deltaproteobacteria bacterium]|nr:radical SAM protein [Deltaproteobacteria bacterium]
MGLLEIERKSRVLTKARFGCLRDVYTLNVTKGCEFMCSYCYARGYPDAPLSGMIYLYRNLPERLAQEIDNPGRRSPVGWVVLNTASDSFQTHPEILAVTYRTMKVLLERGIGFSFLTKGWIPKRFIDLFAEHPRLVCAGIGLVSTSPRYREIFEPKSATVAQRLENIERLKEKGIDVFVRIDPIIPFYTDDEVSIRRIYEALAAREIKTVSLSYLHLRPAILEQLQRELPPTEFRVIRSCFEIQPWSLVGGVTRSKLIPAPLRRKGYQRFERLSREFGISPLVCSCKNPDLPGHRCTTGMPLGKTRQPEREKGRQLSLFLC